MSAVVCILHFSTHIKLCERTPYQTIDAFLRRKKANISYSDTKSRYQSTRLAGEPKVHSSILYLVITRLTLWQKQMHCATTQSVEAATQPAAANLSSSITSSLLALVCLLSDSVWTTMLLRAFICFTITQHRARSTSTTTKDRWKWTGQPPEVLEILIALDLQKYPSKVKAPYSHA